MSSATAPPTSRGRDDVSAGSNASNSARRALRDCIALYWCTPVSGSFQIVGIAKTSLEAQLTCSARPWLRPRRNRHRSSGALCNRRTRGIRRHSASSGSGTRRRQGLHVCVGPFGFRGGRRRRLLAGASRRQAALRWHSLRGGGLEECVVQ